MTDRRRNRPPRPEWNAQPDDGAKAVGPQQSRVPGDRRAPVVSGDHRLLDAERIEQPDHVADEMEQSVVVDRFGPVGLAVAAHVRRDGVESGCRQRRDLMAPGIPGFGKAVTENNQRTVALLGDVQMNAVGFDSALDDGAGRHFQTIARPAVPR